MQGFDAAPLGGGGDAGLEVTAGLDAPGRVGRGLGAVFSYQEVADKEIPDGV